MMSALTGRAALRAVTVLSAPTVPSVPTIQRVGMSSNPNPLGEKERGEEQIYFRKEDAAALRKLAKKMRDQAVLAEKDPDHDHGEKKALKHIVAKYKVSEEDMELLIKWRHNHDF